MTYGNILKRVFFQPQNFVFGQRRADGDNRHDGGIIPLMMQQREREDYGKFAKMVAVRKIMT